MTTALAAWVITKGSALRDQNPPDDHHDKTAPPEPMSTAAEPRAVDPEDPAA